MAQVADVGALGVRRPVALGAQVPLERLDQVGQVTHPASLGRRAAPGPQARRVDQGCAGDVDPVAWSPVVLGVAAGAGALAGSLAPEFAGVEVLVAGPPVEVSAEVPLVEVAVVEELELLDVLVSAPR
ncbi:hypothetical protein [Barrientosiimonas endolithica]|uniref:Uncharacterized protein n=1 Tax=Barrientosiimonas endolithica TaxID=1535208 RepID=A0ABM8HCH1_9MICO|nr:hypothetical protein [Barrientosiimonas endolithica]BDZ58647.1 hypothetical protein GCM10025872_23040 [Barrientosiimonas endolithica]